jgi:hypothetical protein
MLEVHHCSDLAHGVIIFYMKTSAKPAQDITSLKGTGYCRNAPLQCNTLRKINYMEARLELKYERNTNEKLLATKRRLANFWVIAQRVR